MGVRGKIDEKSAEKVEEGVMKEIEDEGNDVEVEVGLK